MSTNSPATGREVERSYAVCSGDREEILRRLRNLKKLGEISLSNSRDLDLRDLYFDTADRDLERYRWALRLRETDVGPFLTLKGPPEAEGGGTLGRPELERPWAPEAYAEVMDALRSRKIRPGSGYDVPASLDPPEALAAAGWRIVHQRRIRRTVLDAVPAGGVPQAELALDRVEFPIGPITVLHLEVEIEGIPPDPAGKVQSLADELLRLSWTGLRSWPYAKLQTGTILKRMARFRTLQSHLDEEGWIDTDGYELMEEGLAAASL
jgi:inorganic triphosphatase YgiF